MADELFNEWRRADRTWATSPFNRPIFEIAFKWFIREGAWPKVSELKRYLFQSSVSSVDVQAIANSKPHIPGQLHLPHQEYLTLGARHVFELPAAADLMDLLVVATQLSVTAYRSSAERPSVRYDDPAFFRFGSDTIVRLPAFVGADYPNPFAGGGIGDEWELLVNENLITDFDGVTNPVEYEQCQLKIIRGWCVAAQPNRDRLAPVSPTSTAFIVMPFREEWSDTMYDFIRRCIDRLDGRLQSVRADEIAMPGRINDQIIEQIRAADLIVADISGLNPNVVWELGFASALEKPCVILMRQGSDVPFDIYDQRRVDYESEPTQETEDHVVALLKGALGATDPRQTGPGS